MVQKLRTLAVLAEGTGLVPRINTEFQIRRSVLASVDTGRTFSVHTCMQAKHTSM